MGDTLTHIEYAIRNAPVRPWPYPHAIVENFLPSEFYEELIPRMPRPDNYDRREFGGKSSDERFRTIIRVDGEKNVIQHHREWWRENMDWFTGTDLAEIMVDKFGAEVNGHLGHLSLLLHDYKGYALGPHTDVPQKIVTLVLYVPHHLVLATANTSVCRSASATAPEGEHRGTSMYIPNNPEQKFPPSGIHYPFHMFKRVATAPYRPNTALLFLRGNNSWHGVEPTTADRQTLQYQAVDMDSAFAQTRNVG